MKKILTPTNFARLLLSLITLGLIMCLTSCYTQKKATKQVIKAQSIYPNIVSKNCATWYPPKVYDSIRTEYVQGETEFYFDTIKINCDSVKSDKKGIFSVISANHFADTSKMVTKIVKVPKLRVDTFYDHQYHTVENTARLEWFVNRLDTTTTLLQKTLIKAKELDTKRLLWLKIALFLILYLSIKTIIRLFFPQFSNFVSKLP